MRPPRFTHDQVDVLLGLDPDATYFPPSFPGAGDDFVELGDGSALPNPERAAAWIQELSVTTIHRVAGPPAHAPAQAPGESGRRRRHLTVIEGGRRAS
jgi:hypothetical protein